MKKLIIAAAVAAVAAGGAVALQTIVNQSDPIFEANVEALTRSEDISGICCPDENDTCSFSWVNISGYTNKKDIGPC